MFAVSFSFNLVSFANKVSRHFPIFAVNVSPIIPMFASPTIYVRKPLHLYVPPYCITPENTEKVNALEALGKEALYDYDFQAYKQLRDEQENLKHFIPVMRHSITEKSKYVVFHSQVLADWNTIVEMSEGFLEELNGAHE